MTKRLIVTYDTIPSMKQGSKIPFLDHTRLDAVAEQLSNALPESIKSLKKDIDNNFRAILETAFSKMNLVSREEFDVQQEVLKRTREKLEELEAMVRELETK